jgi:hypothetical protein
MNNKILRGLDRLESLNLFSNRISCVSPGAFDSLVSIQTLNLMANPFNCNCHMGWFGEWLRQSGLGGAKGVSGPRCAAPAHLKDRTITSLAVHDFRCTGM